MMIKRIIKKFLPAFIQRKIRKSIMHKHKQNTSLNEINNKKELYKSDLYLIKERGALYNSSNVTFNKKQQSLLYQLSKDGVFLGKLDDYYDNYEELLKYMKELCLNTKDKTYKELESIHHSKSEKHLQYKDIHFINLYHAKKEVSDPIKEFMTDPKIFTMAAKYLGEIPQIMLVSFLYTKENTLNERGPMLWHLDRHHDSVFRIFINPYKMTKRNGATMAFPSKYTEGEYYDTYPYFNNTEAEKNGFDLSDIVHLTGDEGMFGVVDTCKNFHAGSRSVDDRYLAILTFVPYLYKGHKSDKIYVGDKNLFQKENEKIYNYFKDNFNSNDVK